MSIKERDDDASPEEGVEGNNLLSGFEIVERRPGSCPVHGQIDFVKLKGSPAFVCPYSPETHKNEGYYVDRLPFSNTPDR